MADSPETSDAPSADDVWRRYLLYTLSLPERTLRSGAGLAGGAVRESAALLAPRAVQDSQTYRLIVRQTLDFLVQDVGGVTAETNDSSEPKVDNFIARKAVGNFLELAGMATIHLSPLTTLAVLADVAYGSSYFLRELAAELKRQQIIDEQATINNVDELLSAVADAARITSSALDTPPVSMEGLRETVQQARAAATRLDLRQALPQAELERLWTDMRALAKAQDADLWSVSTTMTLYSLDQLGQVGKGALSTVRVAGGLFDRHVLDHYRQALDEMNRRGFYAVVAEASEPYIEAVWANFARDKGTLTEDLLTGRLVKKAWHALRAVWPAATRKPGDQ